MMMHTLLTWNPAADTFPAMIAVLAVTLLAVPRRRRRTPAPLDLPDLRVTSYAAATYPKAT